MSFLQRFYSAFPGGEMDLSAGAGSVIEAGGVLTLSSTSPASCAWPTTAPKATKRFTQLAFDTVLKVETRCYGYTGTGNGGEWLSLFKDTGSGNAYFFGWWAADAKIYATRYNVANLASSSAVASPSTSPHTYRIYWNPTARPLFVEDDGASFVIDPNQVQFWYRVGDAGTWTLLHSRTADFTMPTPSLGNFVSNISPFPSMLALYSYIGAYQWDASKQLFIPANDQIPLTNTSVDPKEVLALEDQTQLLTQGGKPVHGMPDGLDQGLEVRPSPLAFEDQVSWLLSLEPEFSTITQDVDLHYHFVYPKPYLAIYCDATLDPWNTPTLNNFTGYGRDGYKYTNGVQDVGPVSAPWRTEASGANRSARADFPVKSLIVVTRLELVIFDLDTFDGSVPTLRVWMRFLLGNSVSDFYALGRGMETVRSVVFSNGQLVVGTTNTGWEGGRVHSVDFKALTPATVYSLCGSDNQWVGQGTKSVVDRNTNLIWAVSGSVRINCEENHSMAVLAEDTNTLYVAISGEDPSPEILKYVGGTLQSSSKAAGEDIGAVDLGNYRQVLFDDVGWLWFSIGSVLYRNCRDWREGYMYPQRTDMRQGQVDLGTTITHLVAAKDNIYAGTAYGVYCIAKGSMQAHLAYTVVGGGGRGRLNIAGTGEKLVGDISVIQSLKSYTLLTGALTFSYLVVGTTYTSNSVGGLTLLRVFDDVVVQSYIAPNIIEPGTYISTAMLA